MALLTVLQSGFIGEGDKPLVAADAGGDTFANDGNVVFLVLNGTASPITLTITTPATDKGLAVADATPTLAANGTGVYGPFDPRLFNATGGIVTVNYSLETSITVAAINVKG